DEEEHIDGSLTVESKLADASSNAITAGSAGGDDVSISVLSLEINKATAVSSTSNTAGIEGGYYNVTNTTKVTAETTSKATAYAATGKSIGVATVGGMFTESWTSDYVSSTVKNAVIKSVGAVTIKATGNTTSKSTSERGDSVGVLNDTVSKAAAKVGQDTNHRQTAVAGVEGGSITTTGSTGNVTVQATNTGSATSVVQRGTTVSAIDIDITSLPTVSFYRTEAYVKGGAKILSSGDIKVEAMEYPGAKSNADGTSIGFAINATDTFGSNTVYSNNKIDIKGELKATEALDIHIGGAATIEATSLANSAAGLFNGDLLKAVNYLERSSIINILAGSELRANYKEINIISEAGVSDNITTFAFIDSFGAANVGKIENKTTIKNRAEVNIGSGVVIEDRFNKVNVRADASVGFLNMRGYADCSGMAVRPYTENILKNTLTAIVNVGASGKKTKIEGRYVNVNAVIGKLNENVYAYAKGASFGADIDAINDVTSNLSATTNVKNTDIIGHDGAVITASTQPEYEEANIRAEARVQLNAVGDAFAKGIMKTTANTSLSIRDDFTYTGANLLVDTYNLSSGRIVNARKTGGFAKLHTSTEGSYFISSGSPVIVNPTLYLGDAAGGIYIDISKHNGMITIRQVGVRREAMIWSASDSLISFQNIANYLPGSAYLNGTKKDVTGVTVYDQTVIPRVIFTNSTDKDIKLNNITFKNSGFINPRVYLNDARWDLTILHTTWAPEFAYLAEDEGDITLNGLIPLYDGKASFIWSGENKGSLYGIKSVTVANIGTGDDDEQDDDGQDDDGQDGSGQGGIIRPLWTHELIVEGAVHVGTNLENPFFAWIIQDENEAGKVDITASGDIWLNLTASQIVVGEPGTVNPDVLNLDVNNITSEEGNIDLVLGQGQNLLTDSDISTVTVPIPGTMEYANQLNTVQLVSGYKVSDLGTMENYRISTTEEEQETGIRTYRLPNGIVFYVNASGYLTRFVEAGSEGDYTINYVNGSVRSVTLSGGTTIDITSGKVSYSFYGLNVAIAASGCTLTNNEVTALKNKGYLVSKDTETGESTYQLPNGTVFYTDSN
ncbi:MAG: hypothetical protein K5647_03385, partial [Clostridiales bacterium]|nr:hypothetical protein [Clostridiales bacterium]